MSIFILIYIFILVFLTLARYSNILQVATAMIFFFGLTTGILLKGLSAFSTAPQIFIFGNELSRCVFIILISIWYCVDLLCSFLVIRNYRMYLRVNG